VGNQSSARIFNNIQNKQLPIQKSTRYNPKPCTTSCTHMEDKPLRESETLMFPHATWCNLAKLVLL